MSKQIPKEDDYSEPFLSPNLQCLNCDYVGIKIRMLRMSLRRKYEDNFNYLCPKCFEQLILRNDKEKVMFT